MREESKKDGSDIVSRTQVVSGRQLWSQPRKQTSPETGRQRTLEGYPQEKLKRFSTTSYVERWAEERG